MSGEMNPHLFVAQLPRTVTVAELETMFAQVGKVVSVTRPRDKETGELRSFAFVEMGSAEEAGAVIEKYHGLQLDGSTIVIKYNDKPPPAFIKKSNAKGAKSDAKPKAQPPKPVEVDWDTRAEWVNAALNAPGTAASLKMTLIGRPEQVQIAGNLVIVSLDHTLRATSLPKGVPTPPALTTRCIGYVALKQWRKIEEFLKDPNDMVIIEGVGFFDPEFGAISILATNTTSKMMMAARTRPPEELPPST